MTVNLKNKLTLFFSAFVFLTTSYKANSQGLLDKLKKKAEDALNKKVEKKVDDVLDSKKKSGETGNTGNTENTNSGERPKFSEIKESDFNQNDANPEFDPKNTRYRIANNLLIDIAGKYPNSYAPKWRFVSYKSSLKYAREDWLRPKAQLYYEDRALEIGSYDGKAVIRFKPHYDCECFADINIKGVVVLTESPQVFELVNFRKILNERSTGEPCIGGLNNAAKGGWGGKISLSANQNGDLVMGMVMEDYTLPYSKMERLNKGSMEKTEVQYPSQVHYRYSAKDITIENEMSAEKATAIVVAEQEAKQRQKDYIAKTTKQADSLQKIIAKKYPQKDCRDCFSRSSNSSLQVTPTKTAYTNGYGDVWVESGTDWDINTKTEIKNKCGYDLTFIGLKQMYDEEKGYYLMEVTKVMEKGYNYRSDQGAMASIFSSLIGGGSEFNIVVQDKYYANYATVGAVQWLKVVKK